MFKCELCNQKKEHLLMFNKSLAFIYTCIYWIYMYNILKSTIYIRLSFAGG